MCDDVVDDTGVKDRFTDPVLLGRTVGRVDGDALLVRLDAVDTEVDAPGVVDGA